VKLHTPPGRKYLSDFSYSAQRSPTELPGSAE
jgi:hypothetical protein